MSWARIDDGFTEHPKILALTDREFRVHMRAICYASRYRTGGEIPASVLRGLGATPRIVRRLIEIGVWDEENPVKIHDFSIYNGDTVEERIRGYIESDPDATANEIHRAVGGKREQVLGIVKRIRGSLGGSPGGTNGSQSGSAPGTGEPDVSGTKEPPGAVHARARTHADPSPTPENQEPRAVPVARPPDDPEPPLNGPGEDLTIRQQIHESLAQARAAGGTR